MATTCCPRRPRSTTPCAAAPTSGPNQPGSARLPLPALTAPLPPRAQAFDNPVNATRHPISLGGHRVYGGYFETGMGYRAQNTTKGAVGNEPETVYMVSSGTHVNAGCCFDCPTPTRAPIPTHAEPAGRIASTTR